MNQVISVRENIIGKDLSELRALAEALGEKPFRGNQLYRHLYRRQCISLEAMTDISLPFRRQLAQCVNLDVPLVLARRDSTDGTGKLLLGLADGEKVEAVYIPEEDRNTLCLSTQAGCAMGCRFCATARLGLRRHLNAGEILGQYLVFAREKNLVGQSVNVVFMGMGEPLQNYAPLMKAFRIMTDPAGLALSRRKITVSTCGLVDGIRRLAAEERRPKLAVSLNAATDEVRDRLMPINRHWPLVKLIQACREFPLMRGERITFEYVLIEGVNDSLTDARQLVKLLRGLPCKINLIPYNEASWPPLRPPVEERLLDFQSVLIEAHYTAIIRKSRGRDIAGACGQLAGGESPGLLPPRP